MSNPRINQIDKEIARLQTEKENLEAIEGGYTFDMGLWCVSSNHVTLNPKPKKEKVLKTYKYTVKNTDDWAITDNIMVVVAESKMKAKQLLNKSGYNVKKTSEIIELKEGLHFIQEAIVE